MNKIQQTLITHIRESIQNKDVAAKLGTFDDNALARQIFFSFRGGTDKDLRGLRLTRFGLTLTKNYFRGYEIKMPEGEILSSMHLIYLDNAANLPYYCDNDGFVIYDQSLGIKLKLADGRISTLIELDRA